MTKSGWTVDCLQGEKSPDYHQGIGDGFKNGGSQKATMTDAPQTSGGDIGFYEPNTNPKGIKEYVINFATFAYCMNGPDCGKWYEGVTWKYTKTRQDMRDGKSGLSTIESSNDEAPSKDLLEAFDLFNKVNGYIPCKAK